MLAALYGIFYFVVALIFLHFVGLLKFLLVKFFTYLVIFSFYISAYFLQISWEVSRELLEVSNISQYIQPIFASLPGIVSDLLVRSGFFDFMVFIINVMITLYVLGFMPSFI